MTDHVQIGPPFVPRICLTMARSSMPPPPDLEVLEAVDPRHDPYRAPLGLLAGLNTTPPSERTFNPINI